MGVIFHILGASQKKSVSPIFDLVGLQVGIWTESSKPSKASWGGHKTECNL